MKCEWCGREQNIHEYYDDIVIMQLCDECRDRMQAIRYEDIPLYIEDDWFDLITL